MSLVPGGAYVHVSTKMTLADICAPLVALPVSWVLLRLKQMLPGAPDRRYRCTLALLAPDLQQTGDQRKTSFPATDGFHPGVSDIAWLPDSHIHHEHYVH